MDYSIQERFQLGLSDTKGPKDEAKYLRRVITTAQKRIKTLLKNPKKVVVSYDSVDGPQRSTNKELAQEHKDVQKRAVKMLNEVNKQIDDDKNRDKKFGPDRDTGEYKRKRIYTRKMKGRGGGGGGIAMPQDIAKRPSLLRKN